MMTAMFMGLHVRDKRRRAEYTPANSGVPHFWGLRFLGAYVRNHSPTRIVLWAAIIGAALAGAVRAEDTSDTTMLLTGRLLKKAVNSAMDTSLKTDSEAGEVMMALRSM